MSTELEGLLRVCLEALKREFGADLVSAVLYGSAARGAAGPDSDVDLLVVTRNLPADRWERQETAVRLNMGMEDYLEGVRGRTGWYPYLSFLLYTPEESSRFRRLYLDMVEEARLLYDREGFFQGILERARERMRSLGAEKVRLGETWYWRFKADYRHGEEFER